MENSHRKVSFQSYDDLVKEIKRIDDLRSELLLRKSFEGLNNKNVKKT